MQTQTQRKHEARDVDGTEQVRPIQHSLALPGRSQSHRRVRERIQDLEAEGGE